MASQNYEQSMKFQSTHPRGMRLCFGCARYTVTEFQSTHPRGMRLDRIICMIEISSISIHASARDATNFDRCTSGIHRFQSTHPRGMRPGTGMYPNSVYDFNPRIREGCDNFRSTGAFHVPNFNPRIREGCDI